MHVASSVDPLFCCSTERSAERSDLIPTPPTAERLGEIGTTDEANAVFWSREVSYLLLALNRLIAFDGDDEGVIRHTRPP